MLAAVSACFALSATATSAPLGRVVALGDSLASGQWLGPQVPGSITDCGQSTGSYPELAMSRVTHGTWVNATCNGTTADNFENGWTGPTGAAIPPQYNSINGSESLVVVGSGNNEAFFGKIAYDCTGYQPAVDAFFHNRDYPQQTPSPIPNHCTDTYLVNGVNQIPQYVAISKSKIASALTRIHQLAPSAKILLVGKPRIAKPSGSQCFNSEFWLTATDAPLYATWEDGVRQAMIDDVNAFNSAVPGNYARFVDMMAISGTSHTACETNWSDRWMNPHTYQQNLQYPGIALHNTPLGASVMANAIVDSIHAFGFDTGTANFNPVVSISAPASGIVTTNATVPVSFTASDNIRIASCSIASGASVALSPGTNTIVVTCLDDAGNSGSASVTVMRDAAPPTISITSPASGSGTTSATAQLSYTASDDVGTPSCTPASGTTVALATGANSLNVSCTDSVGRTASASVTVYRGTPPVVAISAPSDGASTQNTTTNVAFTVNGSATIPNGTTCKVNGIASASAVANSAALSIGANTVSVSCTDIFGSGSAAVTVYRGDPPALAITSPSPSANTAATSTNVSFTVGGVASIPGGTTCKVAGGGTLSATVNPVPLQLGANTITVACTNQYGTSTVAVSVNRGDPPVVAIAAPAPAANIASASTNVSFTVGAAASIPSGTTCAVGGASTVSTTVNSVALQLGANTITVSCTNPFGTGSASVSVTRGDAPTVAITAPIDGLKTTSASLNLVYTVGGASTIPGGTTCSVGGAASSDPSTNQVALALGANTIALSCTNAFGSGGVTVTVTRGVVPAVAITAPTNGLNTTATSANVTYTVDGAASIPAGTSCTVNGATSSSTTSNSVALAVGANAISLACTNAFGPSSTSVTVNRGNAPAVAITAPASGLNTTATSLNLAYTVGGASTIPGGTACTVGGAPSSDPATNQVALALGANALTVSCTNAFGSGGASVSVTRGVAPVVTIVTPTDNTLTSATSVNAAFSLNGAASIPAGTSCTVNGVGTTDSSTNSVALAIGSNTIAVACTNAFGADSRSVTVVRGSGPSVAVTAPASGLSTTATSVNVAFRVDGAASIPNGTTCNVGGTSTASATTNSVALTLGANTITVSCSNALGGDSQSVVVFRGNPPAVAITAPGDGLKTTASAVNVAYTVDGAAAIPNGTTCTAGGASSTSPAANPAALALGANTITVSCTNAFGGGSAAVTVTRGVVPALAISSPTNGLNTSAASVNITYTVDGAASIPAGTSCTVNGSASSSTTSNSVALAVGANTITLACTNAFGPASTSVTVNRGDPPAVAVTTPANGLHTTASSVNVAFTVGGAGTIPGGTTCTVGGASTLSAAVNPVPLHLGDNTVSVACTNAFGAGSASVTVTRGVVPAVVIVSPESGLNTNASALNVAFTVDGASTIPGGTTCTVGGASSANAAVNSVALQLGANTIAVSCTNAFGSGGASATVTRGNPPAVAISAPTDGLKTTSASLNVAYSVGGANTIPSGTSCTVGGASSSNPATNPVALAIGANTIALSCTNAFGTGNAAVTVTRGVVPAVAVTAPANGLNTTASSVNVNYTVDGGSSIPAGTSCTVNGSPSSGTSSSSISLQIGANTIALACTNAFGAASTSVTVNRGIAPTVAITTPVDGLKTTATSLNVAYTLGGADAIPGGTACTVGGSVSTTPATNPVTIGLGVNTVSVSCENAFGIGSDSITVTRGTTPTVAIVSPASGAVSDVPSLSLSFLVDGSAEIPAGTSCSVGGVPTAIASGVVVTLTPGTNTIAVSCSNAYGDADTQTLTVSYSEPPVTPPTTEPGPEPAPPSSLAAPTISAITPRRLRPGSSGSEFSKRSRRSSASFRVTLASPEAAQLSIERLDPGHSGRVSNWRRFALPGGTTTIYLSGRARGRALAPGHYRVRMTVGTARRAVVSQSFRVIR